MTRLQTLAVLAFVFPCGLAAAADPVSFQNDVMAVLSRAGCNSGACHGNLNGKGGLRLSLRGEDAALDWQVLTRDMLARRTDPASPEESLLLKKATGQVPHEGGIRFAPTTPEYAIFRDWIANGCEQDPAETPRLRSLEVTPTEAILIAPTESTQIRVRATFSNGSTRDVTHLTTFETTNLGVARVGPLGEVTREQYGELVVLVRYLHLQVPVRIAFVPDRPVPDLAELQTDHPIDRLVAVQLRSRRLPASPVVTDAVFIRRAYLDTCGVIPPAEDVRAFLADRSPDKRAKLVDRLLETQEFADFWALKWSDLLRNEEKSLDRKGVQNFHRWMKSWFSEDRPLNEFAREVLSARGSTYQNPPANFYRAVRDPYLRAEAVAQVFLGIRVNCARCHNHPFDVWTQDDYHQLVAFFPRIDYRVLENNRRDALDKHEFVGEQIVIAQRQGETVLPRTGKPAAPKFLGGDTPDLGNDVDRLARLADWIADPENPFFARAQANRIWFHLMGRGLVDPNDDFRTSNPAANPELLDHLAATFARGEYRLRPLIRHIMMSHAYQLDSTPVPGNETDELHGSHALVRPLTAEQLLDALSRAMDRPVKFNGYPMGLRAGALPALPQSGRRFGTPTSGERFMRVFGKPERLLTCECERSDDAGLLQAFQLITGPMVNTLLQDTQNRIGRHLATNTPAEELLDDLYLAALSRYPSSTEREQLLAYLDKAGANRAAWEDIAWGLVNAKEFLLRH